VRRVLVLATLTAMLIALVPANAPARHTLPHRVSVLEAKVAALQKRVNALSNFTHNCLGWDWAPLTSYGDSSLSVGYVFDNDGAGAQPPVYTTALDFTEVGDPVHAHVPVINPACVRSVARVAAVRGGESSRIARYTLR
jgi:hypothetical protein